MAKALGIGGVFFKARDPEKLAHWYEQWLGLELGPGFCGSIFQPRNLPPEAYSLWSPFPSTTDYFAPSEQAFMINLIVDDVDAVLAQAVQGGAKPVDEPQTEEFGRFGWFMDPEGNKVELWKPAPPAA